MLDLGNFRADSELKKEGVEIPFGEDSSVTVRSSSDAKFVNYWSKIQKKHRNSIEKGTLPEVIGNELLAKAMSQRLVIGWKNLRIPASLYQRDFVQDEFDLEGVEPCENPDKDDDVQRVLVPYSKSNCYNVLLHPNYSEFRTWIMSQAGELSNFQTEDIEDDVGN